MWRGLNCTTWFSPPFFFFLVLVLRHSVHNQANVAGMNKLIRLPAAHRWLQGSVVNESGSWARLSWDGSTDGMVYGSIFSSMDGGWVVEPDHATGQSVLVRGTAAAAHTGEAGHMDIGIAADPLAATYTSESRRRRQQQSSAHLACGVFLDADSRYFEQYKGKCADSWSASQCTDRQLQRVAVRMIDTFHFVDGVFETAAGLRTLVAGTHVITTIGASPFVDGACARVCQWLGLGQSVALWCVCP